MSSLSSSATRSTTVPSGKVVGSSRTSHPFSTRARRALIWLLYGIPRCSASVHELGGAGAGELFFRPPITLVENRLMEFCGAHQISEHGVEVARGRLEVRMDQTLARRYRAPQNRRLANYRLREREALFTFLSYPGLEATNWRVVDAPFE